MTENDETLDNIDLEDEYEEDEDFPEVVRAKWSIDGASTFSEAADKLVDFANYLLELEAEGKQLLGPIEDDYGFYK